MAGLGLVTALVTLHANIFPGQPAANVEEVPSARQVVATVAVGRLASLVPATVLLATVPEHSSPNGTVLSFLVFTGRCGLFYSSRT